MARTCPDLGEAVGEHLVELGLVAAAAELPHVAGVLAASGLHIGVVPAGGKDGSRAASAFPFGRDGDPGGERHLEAVLPSADIGDVLAGAQRLDPGLHRVLLRLAVRRLRTVIFGARLDGGPGSGMQSGKCGTPRRSR
jgi:hypothetical protein